MTQRHPIKWKPEDEPTSLCSGPCEVCGRIGRIPAGNGRWRCNKHDIRGDRGKR